MSRLIFCASPGRCGTKYLARILGLIPGVVAKHEPAPHFVSVAGVDRGTLDITKRFWAESKMPAIERYLEEAGASIYVETDHTIMRGFYEALPELGVPCDIIVLKRPHREVALSLWRRNSIPGRTKHGKRHRPQPGGNNLRSLRAWKGLSDYQRCYWVCLEIAARSEEMANLVASFGGSVHRTSLKRIITEQGFRSLLASLHLPEPNWIEYRIRKSRVVNETPTQWAGRWPCGDLDKMEREVRGRIIR